MFRTIRRNRSTQWNAYESTSTWPDGSWKGAGTCTDTFKSGDKKIESWEEGSHLKEYPYKYTGGSRKYEGATGGGTYTMEELTDTLLGGRYKGELILR